jgi:hypothetical protein
MVRSDLKEHGIEIREEIVLPGEGTTPRGVLNELTRGKTGLVVVAAAEVIRIIRDLVILDRFDYAFSSFTMARELPKELARKPIPLVA